MTDTLDRLDDVDDRLALRLERLAQALAEGRAVLLSLMLPGASR